MRFFLSRKCLAGCRARCDPRCYQRDEGTGSGWGCRASKQDTGFGDRVAADRRVISDGARDCAGASSGVRQKSACGVWSVAAVDGARVIGEPFGGVVGVADDGGLGWGEADCVGCVVVDGFAGAADGACDLGTGHTGVYERPDAGEFGRGDGRAGVAAPAAAMRRLMVRQVHR